MQLLDSSALEDIVNEASTKLAYAAKSEQTEIPRFHVAKERP